MSVEDPQEPEAPEFSEELMHAVRAEWRRIVGNQTPQTSKFSWLLPPQLPLPTGDELLDVLRSIPTGAGTEGMARRFRELSDSPPNKGSRDAQ